MRRIYWLAAMTAVLSFGSCSGDREIDNTQTKNEGREIGFRSFIDKGTISRATVTDESNILGFTVTGWWDKTGNATTPGDISDAPADEYMFNAFDITRREANDALDSWSYTPKRYWPAPEIIGGGISFFAYSPASSQGVTKAKGLYNYKGGSIEYTVPDPSRTEPQEDFLLARTNPKKDDGKVKTDGDVVLSFAHALSRVRFFAYTKKTSLTYVIGGVEMMNLAKTGSIDINNIAYDGKFEYNDTDPASTPVILWADQTAPGKIAIDMGDSPINLLGAGKDNKYHSLQGETNALMVLPQTTAPGVIDKLNPENNSGFLIKISYKAYLNNPDGTYYAGSKDKWEEIYFAVNDALRSQDGTPQPFSFEIGRQYNFCFEFGSEVGDEIKFNATVAPWDNSVPEVKL